MFSGVKTGIGLVRHAFRVFRHYPRFMVPLFLAWLVYAPTVLWFQFFFDVSQYTFQQALLIGFGITFFFAFVLAFSCSMVLEMIEQVENGYEPRVIPAFTESVTRNLISMIPLVLVWSIIWFTITVIQALAEDSGGSGGDDLTAESAARTLGGGGPTSLLGLSLDALKKGVRMLVFLMLPAMAWEDYGFIGGVKRGWRVFKSHLSAFATGFSLTWTVMIVIFLPVTIVFELEDAGMVHVPELGWYLLILYIGVGWSFSIYLEQMFAAGLYLWHLKWEREVTVAEQEGRQAPEPEDIRPPSLLDDVPELAGITVRQQATQQPKEE